MPIPSRPGVQTAAIIEMTQSGTILCGSSREFAGFDTRLDRPTMARIMRDCVRVVPGLADLRVIRGYAGLRPYCRDGLPAIGPVDAHGRLHIATGHEGTGHGLAPVTGAIVAGLFERRRPSPRGRGRSAAPVVMTASGFRSVLPPGDEVAITVDGVAVTLRARPLAARSTAAGDRAGAAADFFCAIGQCQRCLVVMDGRAVLACLAYPKGGEAVSTAAVDRRPPPWT